LRKVCLDAQKDRMAAPFESEPDEAPGRRMTWNLPRILWQTIIQLQQRIDEWLFKEEPHVPHPSATDWRC